jgi:hypothetical protein
MGKAMTYRGRVKQGVIVLDSPVQLPEGAEVEVRASLQVSAEEESVEAETQEEEALVFGSVTAAAELLSREDLSDWEK